MSPYYTRKGDNGTTSWLGKGRIEKFNPRLETLGALEEASAFLGFARAQVETAQIKEALLQIQRDLSGIMAEVAADPKEDSPFRILEQGRVTWLEEQTDQIAEAVGFPKDFLIPGDTVGGGALDYARAVVRRAERRVVELHRAGGIINTTLIEYLNRLSSLLFAMEFLEIRSDGVLSPSLTGKSPTA